MAEFLGTVVAPAVFIVEAGMQKHEYMRFVCKPTEKVSVKITTKLHYSKRLSAFKLFAGILRSGADFRRRGVILRYIQLSHSNMGVNSPARKPTRSTPTVDRYESVAAMVSC